MRAVVASILCVLLIVPALPGTCPAGPCDVPPFISMGGMKPNVLIILDNSNSMDENFYGAAVGSYSTASKSVVARRALNSIINSYRSRLKLGLMGFAINTPSSVKIHNSPYFVSYQPKSFCNGSSIDNATLSACVNYCRGYATSITNSTILGYRSTCDTGCKQANSLFDPDYFDEIITNYSANSEQRTRYCSLVYPKTMALPNPNGSGSTMYVRGSYPYYSSNNDGIRFLYATPYYAVDGNYNSLYYLYAAKNNTSDDFSGYTTAKGSSTFVPTDSDYALGFKNFGRRMAWYYVGPAWYVNSSPGGGYLFNSVTNVDTVNGATAYSSLMTKLNTFQNATVPSTYYMSCYSQSSSTCPVINAGLTPTAGTFQSAYKYFAGTLSGYSTPMSGKCQKNFVVFVTDGLPSVDANGNTGTASALMPAVLTQISNLRSVPNTTYGSFDVKTYVLGVGLTSTAKAYLDQMAVAGGTATSEGHAYYADTPEQLVQSLNTIFSIVGASVGSAGAVATVSQEISSGDVVVRGAFRSYNATNPEIYTWQGHLESYWPYRGCPVFTTRRTCNATAGCSWNATANSGNGNCTGTIYSFQLSHNSNNSLFCSDSSSVAANNFTGGHCLDGGWQLKSRSYSDRTIFSFLNGAWTTFDNSTSNFTKLKPFLANKFDFNGTGNCSKPITDGDTKALIKWVRGGNATNSRQRYGWKLGDIAYSTPVVVSSPSLASIPRTLALAGCTTEACTTGTAEATQCFSCFNQTYLHRDQVVYVGANDGMLHAFTLGRWSAATNDTIFDPSLNSTFQPYLGKERWAYAPSNLLSTLQVLASPTYGTDSTSCSSTGCRHRYMVDLTPQSWDVRRKVSGSPAWRTVLLGGERDGGDVYFALDVTDANAASANNASVIYEHSVLKNFPGPATVTSGNTTVASIFANRAGRYYNATKTLPLSRSMPCMARFYSSDGTLYAGISGGGIREYNVNSTLTVNSTTTTTLGRLPGWKYLYYPIFRAVAMNGTNGTDLWHDTWQTFLTSGTSYTGYFPVTKFGSRADNNTKLSLPWGIANVAAFDVFGSDGRSLSLEGIADGFHDVAYAGDIRGTLYTLRLKGGNSSVSSPTIPRCMLVRKTKNIPTANQLSNEYRGTRQPINVTPVAAFDTDGNLRLYFGTGKYDNVYETGYDDKNDTAKMTFYCMVEDMSSSKIACSGNSTGITSPFPIYQKCNATDSTHYWVNSTTASGGDSCFPCSLDLTTTGERVTDSALVAGGYVFFTTFFPDSDRCSGSGNSSLYVMDYMCRKLANSSVIGGANAHLNVGSTSWSSGPAGTNAVAALKIALGRGMASRPVLDSTGTNLLIQTSENKLIRINLDMTDAIRSIIRGWNTGPYTISTTSP